MDYSQLPHDDGFENAFADEPRRTGILSPGLGSPRPLFDDDPAIGGFGSPRSDAFGGGIGSDGGFGGIGGNMSESTEEERVPTSPPPPQHHDDLNAGFAGHQQQHYQQPTPQSPPPQQVQKPQPQQQQPRQPVQQQRPEQYLHAKITALERTTGRKDPILRFDVHVSLSSLSFRVFDPLTCQTTDKPSNLPYHPIPRCPPYPLRIHKARRTFDCLNSRMSRPSSPTIINLCGCRNRRR